MFRTFAPLTINGLLFSVSVRNMDEAEIKTDCHETRVIATNGKVFRLKVVEIERVILSRRFVSAVFLFCTLIAIIDPELFAGEVMVLWRIAFWNLNGWIVIAVWYGMFRAFARYGGPIGSSIPVPSALMIGTTIFVLLHFNYWLAGVLLNEPDIWVGSLYWDILRYTAVAIVFETAVASLLLPRLLYAMRREERAGENQDAAAQPEREDVPEEASVDLNGRRRDLSDVLYFKSAEHYVEVVLHDARELVRTSLKEIVNGFAPEDGVQPHRSYWVSRGAIVGLNRASGAQFLVLRNGEEIPVSRSRRRHVNEWVQSTLLDK